MNSTWPGWPDYQTHRGDPDLSGDTAALPALRPVPRRSTPVHRHGVAWDEVPPPARWLRWAHLCTRHTHFWQATPDGVARELVEWCRCGGERRGGGPWEGRFSRT